ncbi:MAG: hypothetical protein HY698_10360 [Deltaproteobacteria bacterium]|nr:hypothetical protein [Deltaproteobacteria bacterium]
MSVTSVDEATQTDWVTGLAQATLVLNLLDGVFTLLVVLSGLAVEANPLMGRLLDLGPVQFMVGKTALVSMGVWLLWRMRSNRLAVAGLMATMVVYALLVLYHIQATTFGTDTLWSVLLP